MAEAHTYQESVGRYRIVKHEIITDPAIRAQYTLRGLDPDEQISLIYSYDTKDTAENSLQRCHAIDDKVEAKFGSISWRHYIIDNGEGEYITRTTWF